MIVALVGADGTGKSTQATLLVEWLNDSGVPARYFENGGGRPLLDPLARRLGRPDGRTLLGRAYVPVEASFRRLGIARAVRGSRHRT